MQTNVGSNLGPQLDLPLARTRLSCLQLRKLQLEPSSLLYVFVQSFVRIERTPEAEVTERAQSVKTLIA